MHACSHGAQVYVTPEMCLEHIPGLNAQCVEDAGLAAHLLRPMTKAICSPHMTLHGEALSPLIGVLLAGGFCYDPALPLQPTPAMHGPVPHNVFPA